MDYFSKWPEAEALPDKSAAGVAMFLYKLFCRFVRIIISYMNEHTIIRFPLSCRLGCCDVIISDQGREFVNCVDERLCQLTGVKHHVTSAYHPQSNGLTERFNQTLQTALLKFVSESQNDWDDHLPAILFAYRTSNQKATKVTPFEVMYCR